MVTIAHTTLEIDTRRGKKGHFHLRVINIPLTIVCSLIQYSSHISVTSPVTNVTKVSSRSFYHPHLSPVTGVPTGVPAAGVPCIIALLHLPLCCPITQTLPFPCHKLSLRFVVRVSQNRKQIHLFRIPIISNAIHPLIALFIVSKKLISKKTISIFLVTSGILISYSYVNSNS